MDEFSENQSEEETLQEKEQKKDSRLNMVMFLSGIIAFFAYIMIEFIFVEKKTDQN